MPLFSSALERRLWAATLAVVIAIYSTLGLARTLNEALLNRDLLTAAFGLGMVLVGATIVTQGLKTRPDIAGIGVVLGIVAAYFMVFTRMVLPEERSHLIEYSVVAVFIYEALTERARQGRRIRVPALLAILATGLVGALDECIQAFLPSRTFDPQDMLFNILASVLAVAASLVLGWVLQYRTRKQS
jgi:hypothetical protein